MSSIMRTDACVETRRAREVADLRLAGRGRARRDPVVLATAPPSRVPVFDT
ncbi:hypothetical protein ACWD4V_29075 [Streptomyces tsukubensis]|uniref:hypothetical protein n=1 Tax=Streptomyces tsukubensis TaxID=83656 RepID=UPI00369E41AA